MSKSIAFDTLNYAKMLNKGGVAHADVHSASLAEAISHNIYLKSELDMKFDKMLQKYSAQCDAAMARSDEKFAESGIRFEKMLHEFRQDSMRLEQEMTKLELRLEKSINRTMYTAASIISALVVIMGAVATFSHAIFH